MAPEQMGQSEESKKAQEALDRHESAKEKIKELEDDPPKDLKDWPDDEAKYLTFGGGEGDHGYDEGPEAKLGPSSLEHVEGGGVRIEGEDVDNPDEYKGDPIPGGPTDPNAPGISGEDAEASGEERSEGEGGADRSGEARGEGDAEGDADRSGEERGAGSPDSG